MPYSSFNKSTIWNVDVSQMPGEEVERTLVSERTLSLFQ